MEVWLSLTLIGIPIALVLLALLLVSARRELKEKTERLEHLENDLRGIWDAKTRVEQEVKRLADTEQQDDVLREENARLREQLAEIKKKLQAGQERIRWLQGAEEELRAAFKASIAEVLQGNGDQFLNRAREQLGNPSRSAEKTLEQLDIHIRDMEEQRQAAYNGLKQKLKDLAHAHQQLQGTTKTLVEVLKSLSACGHWGEVPLRRVLQMAEMAAITKYVHFNEQQSAPFEEPASAAATEPGPPDMIVRLPNERILPIDAKIPIRAYVEAMEALDEKERNLKLDEHARAMRQRILELGARSYWDQFETPPEVVAMFVPSDECLSLAVERDPDLLVLAVEQRVLPITLAVLPALLSVVAYGWQQHEVAEDAREVVAQGKELYDRLGAFFFDLGDMGKHLDQAVGDFFGSLESRILPPAGRVRRMAWPQALKPSLCRALRAIQAECRPLPSKMMNEAQDNRCNSQSDCSMGRGIE